MMDTAIRDDTHELEVLVSQLAEQAGARLATSPGEATAAAFVNGRLRRAGMGVSTYELRSAPLPGRAYAILGALGFLAATLTPIAPLLGLILALNVLAWLLVDTLGAPIPPVGRRRASQNIVGTRAVIGAAGLQPVAPRWRVVLLAPLDSPAARAGLAALAGQGRTAATARLGSIALVVVGALATLVLSGPWWLASLAGGLGALLLCIAALRPLTAAPTDGGLAALAALMVAIQRIEMLHRVELWAVAVGATGTDPRGVASLLAPRYPFDRERTLFIALEQLAGAQVVYGTREGAGGQADETLLRLAAAADAADPQIDAEPRPLSEPGVLAAPLRRHGYKALTILARPLPSTSTATSTQPLDPRLIERTARLVVGMVRRLEEEA